MQLSPDRKTLILDIAEELPAAKVELLITLLAERRAQMDPPVTRDLSAAMDSDLQIAYEPDPHISMRSTKDGKIQLGIRNSGFGWLFFPLSRRDAAALRDSLSAQLGPDTPSTIFTEHVAKPDCTN